MTEKEKRRENIITSEGAVIMKKVWKNAGVQGPSSIVLRCREYTASSTERLCGSAKGKKGGNHRSLFTEGNRVTVLCPKADLREKHVVVVERPGCSKKVEVHARVPWDFIGKVREKRTEARVFPVVGVGSVGGETYYEVRVHPETSETVWVNKAYEVCGSNGNSNNTDNSRGNGVSNNSGNTNSNSKSKSNTRDDGNEEFNINNTPIDTVTMSHQLPPPPLPLLLPPQHLSPPLQLPQATDVPYVFCVDHQYPVCTPVQLDQYFYYALPTAAFQ